MLNEYNGCEYQCKLSHIDICTLGSPCPNQRSTQMTNEEWFCGLSTKEKAHFFAERFGGSADRYNNIYDTMLEWLKQPHSEVAK